jgi:hypothetical protein
VFADPELQNSATETLAARDISSDIVLAKDENERRRTKVGATRRRRETVAALRLGKKRAVFVGISANPLEDSAIRDRG